MTAKRLYESLGKMMDKDPSLADLEVATSINVGDGPETPRMAIGRACYWDVYDDRGGERRMVIVSQPIDWRFGRPDSPAALRAAAEKTGG
jgi:hypothetical protein